MKKLIIVSVAVVVILLLWVGYTYITESKQEAGNSQMTKTQETFFYENSSADLIRVQLPFPGAKVSRDFVVRGEARGSWFFEASFPVFVVDQSNNQIGSGIAQAEGEWMTDNFVPFSAPILIADYTGDATIILMKDNPSGDPAMDALVSFLIHVVE